MITWEYAQYNSKKIGNFFGISLAEERQDMLRDVQSLWLKVFEEQMPHHDFAKWNSMHGSLEVDRGSVALVPLLDFDLHKQLPYSALYFQSTEAYLDEIFEQSEEAFDPTNDPFEIACDAEEEKYVSLLMEAWNGVKNHPAIRTVLNQRSIPFRIINSPEEDVAPLLETVLQ